MKALKTVYNFLVGDWIILSGIVLVILLLTLIHLINGLAALRGFSGLILIGVTLAVLIVTLGREAYGQHEN